MESTKSNIFEYIDELACDPNRKVAIWGAGETAKILFELTNITKPELFMRI